MTAADGAGEAAEAEAAREVLVLVAKAEGVATMRERPEWAKRMVAGGYKRKAART